MLYFYRKSKAMKSVFKNNIGGEHFSFYRTILEDKIVYFAMFGKNCGRQSFKISKENGNWNILSMNRDTLDRDIAAELIDVVKQNEN
jgi:hypothetical protein